MNELICKELECNETAVKEDRCREHYIAYEEIAFLDNSDWNDLGICKWLKKMYPDHYRDNFSQDHLDIYVMLLELYDARYVNKMHRLREAIAYRGFSKSKIIFGIISYITMHNGMEMTIKATDGKISKVTIKEKFIVVFSETGGMAEDFVVNIRDEFSINPMIRYFYKFAISDAKEEDTGQWTRKAFKINGLFILGLGAGQQARGKIRGAYRPTFAFYDDIYSENNTKTDTTRKGIKDWFYNAAQHSVDDLLGKSFLVGTIVHDDTVLIECEKSKLWRTLKYLPMPVVKFRKFIDENLRVDLNRDSCELPYDDEEDEFLMIDKQVKYFKKLEDSFDWELSWRDRMGLYQLSLKYKEAVENRAVGGFYQEYFHVTIPSELRKFNREYFRDIKGEWAITHEYGYNWFVCKDMFPTPQAINIEFGLDLASGLKEGDNVSITVAGVLPDGTNLILEQKYGKFTMRDNVANDDLRIDRILLDRAYVSKIGYIDETFRLSMEYLPRVIKIGTGGGLESSVVNEMIRVFRENQNYTIIIPRVQSSRGGSKEERIRETLLPKYETMSVYHRKGLKQLEYELEFLGKASNDDNADSLEVSFFNMHRPIGVDYNMFNREVKKNPIWGYAKPDDSGSWLKNWRVN